MIGQIVTGIINNRRAKKLRKKGERLQQEAEAKRTDFTIPDEIQQNIDMAENDAFGRPALQGYLEEIAAREEANNLSAVSRYATSSADALAAAAGVNNQSAQALGRAAAAGEEVRQQNKQQLYGARREMADYRTMAWDMNVNIPYLQRMQFAQQMQGAGQQGQIDATNSIGRGVDNLIGTAANFAIPGIGKLIGGGGNPADPTQAVSTPSYLAPMGPVTQYT